MQRNSGARLFPMFISLIVIIIAVVAVVSIGRALFFGGGDSASELQNTAEADGLTNTDVGRSVRLTVRGPIVADENFKSYTIQASPSARTMNVYKGYLDATENSRSYDNSQPAYEEFVYALDKANMMKGTASTEGVSEDLRGICATGYLYEYATVNADRTIKRLWTSTCGGSKGTLDASVDQLNSLFQKQIPDYNDLTPFKQSPLDGLQF